MSFKFKSVMFASLATLAFTALPGAATAQDYNPRSSYADPDSTTTDVWKRRGPCGDPWVSIALSRVYGTVDPAKCNVALYNGGRWNNYNELVHAVGRQKNAGGGTASAPKPTIDLRRLKYDCPTPSSCSIFSNDGDKVGVLTNGNFQPELPAKIVAAGGGNLVGNDGASLVGNDGASLVAAGSLNLIAQKVNMNPPASPLRGYALQGVNDFRALAEKTRHR